MAVQQSMEVAEKKKHDLKVMEMLSLAAKGSLSGFKVGHIQGHCAAQIS